MCNQPTCSCKKQEDYSSIDYQLSILQALKEGKTIEVAHRDRVSGQPFGVFEKRTVDWPLNFQGCCYRVKREPLEVEVWMREGGSYLYRVGHHTDPSWEKNGWRKVKMREMIED